jgi:hypothetical protein
MLNTSKVVLLAPPVVALPGISGSGSGIGWSRNTCFISGVRMGVTTVVEQEV